MVMMYVKVKAKMLSEKLGYEKRINFSKLNMQPSGNPRNSGRILGDQKFR